MSTAHWLALTTVPGIGGVTVRKLLDRFGDVESIFAATVEELTEIPRVTPAVAGQLLAAPLEALEADLLSLDDEGIDLLTWDDDRFPPHLRALPDAPMVLFLRGSIRREDAQAVAIVGTRTPSENGVQLATALGRELASRGLTIVSGLALGVDTAAHQGALEAEHGRTLAVLGSGIRFIHPKENVELAEQIAGRGALLSELHPNTPPRGQTLMARDRIVSGLSRAVIVVEAGEKSGSLDTAAKAVKQGRRVYAVPGSPGAEQLLAGGAARLDPDALDYDALASEIARHPLPDESSSPPRQTSLW
jgi:DNA processing protein